ncbi:MAG: choice-of-anchor Q domain-containing protein, partial [Candidatus Parabeggiatoa sp.]|nr:choice-of-anchor Q domain-containing protein [Candidatus Parabeggiatoa sp.]
MIYKPITNAKCQTLSRLGLKPHFVLALIWALFLVPATYAIEVSNTNDTGTGSLRAAIAAGGIITFDSGLNKQPITVSSTLTIGTNLTIEGNGASNTIIQANATKGSASDRVFTISSGKTVTIKNVTIQHGNLSSSGYGGGILNSGSLTLENGTVSNNIATGSKWGGGIYNTGTLEVNNSTISHNEAKYGGGIFNDMGGTLTLNNSTVSSNTATTSAGGIRNKATATIKNSIIAGNTGGDCSGTITSQGYNIVGDGCPSGGTDQSVSVSTVLASFDTSLGLFPLNTSDPSSNPAIDAIPTTADCGSTPPFNVDQLGTSRPQGEKCDIGAYEYKSQDDEPTNHPTDFTATVDSDTAITLTWTDSTAGTGEQLPANYLILGKKSGSVTDPTDGTPVDDDTDWAGDSVAVNVAYDGDDTYQFTGLTPETQYDFKIYPYTNADDLIDFKTDAAPETSEETLASEPTNHPTGFTAAETDTVIKLTWTGSTAGTGEQLPHKYLIVGKTGTGTYATVPSNGSEVTDDTDWDSVAVNVAHATGSITHTFSGLTEETQYDFQIYPYTNENPNIKYKTDSPKELSVRTNATDPEPTHHATGFEATVNSDSILTLIWTDATAGDGEQAPSGYLIKLSNTSFEAITDPTNAVADDSDVSDGSGAINITQGTQTYQWTGLTAETTYYFKLYPYTNAAATIDYKTDGDIPQIEILTHVSIPEPSEQATDFTATAENNTLIKLTWTGSIGDQVPANYLIVGKTGGGGYAAVNDGTPVTDDTDWAGDSVAVNVNHADGENTYTFTGLTPEIDYDFQIYPYTNADTTIDYKTDGTVPSASVSTLATAVEPSNPPSGFTATADSDTTITLSWTDATGDPLPFGYLIK